MKGFLLPETILSLFILSIGLITVVSLIASSLRESLGSRDIITATLLAQEGIELVRNVRDNGFVKSTATPINPFEKFSGTDKYCKIDYTYDYSTNITCAGSFTPDPLEYISGFYRSGASGKFSRSLYIDYNSTAETALIRSFVSWGPIASDSSIRTGGASDCTVANKCVYTEINLTNWKQ